MRERDVVPYQILNGTEIQFFPMHQFHQAQAAHLGRRNTRRLENGGAGKEKSLEIVVTQVTCSSKLGFCLDFLGDHPDVQFSVAVYQPLLVGGRGLLEIHFQNVHERGKCLCPSLIRTVVERESVALLPEFVESGKYLLVRW